MAGRKKSERPFRVYDESAKLDLPHRAYVDPKRAIERCLSLLYWLEVGNSYTVYDERSSTALMQVTRGVNGFKFYYDNGRRY